jgi:hypothetical protein
MHMPISLLDLLFCGTWEALITWKCCSSVLESFLMSYILNGLVRSVFISPNHPNIHWDPIPKSVICGVNQTSATYVALVTVLTKVSSVRGTGSVRCTTEPYHMCCHV